MQFQRRQNFSPGEILEIFFFHDAVRVTLSLQKEATQGEHPLDPRFIFSVL
jgi:hypothetical protein